MCHGLPECYRGVCSKGAPSGPFGYFFAFMNGYHWCQELRRVSRVPIIFLSSAADNMNIVMAMNMGADDFIAKPFDENVLIAKIQALLRRAYDFGEGMPVLEHRGALLNTGDGSLSFQGQRINLSKNEFRILVELMRQKGKIVKLMFMKNLALVIGVTVGIYLLFGLFYAIVYKVTAGVYYNIVGGTRPEGI